MTFAGTIMRRVYCGVGGSTVSFAYTSKTKNYKVFFIFRFA